MVPGLPPISVDGTKFATSSKNDLVDVYKLFMKTKMEEAGNALPPLLDADFAEVREMLRLPEQCDPDPELPVHLAIESAHFSQDSEQCGEGLL